MALSFRYINSLKNLVTRGEILGIDSFWVMDHFQQILLVGKQDEPVLESWTTISVLAGVSSKIKLGTMMTGIIYRHPSILANVDWNWNTVRTVKSEYKQISVFCIPVRLPSLVWYQWCIW